MVLFETLEEECLLLWCEKLGVFWERNDEEESVDVEKDQRPSMMKIPPSVRTSSSEVGQVGLPSPARMPFNVHLCKRVCQKLFILMLGRFLWIVGAYPAESPANM